MRRSGRGGSRRLGGRRTAAALGHELVELGAILGRPQLVEIVAELVLFLVELAQRLLAIFVEGDVAARVTAPARAALPGAELLTSIATDVATGVATLGSIPAAVTAM